MKYSKAQNRANFHKLPELRFEDQKLTSFSGLLLFQALFARLNLKDRLKRCFTHLDSSSTYGAHRIVLLLIVHLILGFRRLRDVSYYRDDPMVARVVGLRRLPDVSTISRALAKLDPRSVEAVRGLSQGLVLDALEREQLARHTLDFDGSLLSSSGHAEGTAVGFNPKKKGARSYYPLFCTVAQTGQILDFHHRPGNVHDSNGAPEFIGACLTAVRHSAPRSTLEARLDSAFFSEKVLTAVDEHGAEFTIAVPFERFCELKTIIEDRKRWNAIDEEWAYFETAWRPKSWDKRHRFVFVRKRIKRQEKGPLQLELFKPVDFEYEYKVIVTNKKQSAKAVLLFHNGRGAQEALFGHAKQHAALGVIPARRLAANQTYTACATMAHNLARELQMLTQSRRSRSSAKRPAAWFFETLDTLRHRIIQRAGRLTRPQGQLTLTMSPNPAVEHDLTTYLQRLQQAA